MGGIGAVGADGAGPSESLSPGIGLLVLQLVTPNISGTKGNFGQSPDRIAPHKHSAFSYTPSSFCLPKGQTLRVS